MRILFLLLLLISHTSTNAQSSCSPARALVSGYFTNIFIYDLCSGAFERVLENTPGRLNGAQAIWQRPDGKLYVVSELTGQILRYDAATFAFVDIFIDTGVAFAPTGVAFAPNGDIYVGGFNADSVRRYSGVNGALLSTPIAPRAGGLNGPDNGMTFGPDGKLYVPSYESGSVLRFDPSNNQLSTFIASGVGGLRRTREVLFEPGNATVLVSSEGSNQILRFNATTGALIGVFANVTRPAGMNYTNDGRLLVATNVDQVIALNATTGALIGPLFPTGGSGGLNGATYVAVVAKSATTVAQTNLVSIQSAGPNFGWEVDPIADLNGDGVDEFIAASPNRAGDTGAVEVRSGKDGASILNFANSVGGSQFGYSIDDAGDVNRDGVNDVIVGAPLTNGFGAAYVYSGKSGALIFTKIGDRVGGQFGSRVASAGDIDADGYADFMIGAEQYPDPVLASGRVFIYSGKTGNQIRQIAAQSNAEGFGSGLETIGDIDGDRIGDLVIGAFQSGASRGGRAYVFSSVTGARLLTLESPTGAVEFGQAFASDAGDFNGDGKEDIFVGDYAANGGNGRAVVYSGIDGAILFRVEGSTGAGVGTGRGVHDLNGDGFGDLVIGHWTHNEPGRPQAGKVVIYAGPDGRVLQTINNTIAGENFGFDAGTVGDTNDDGLNDIVVGAASGNRVAIVAGQSEAAGRAVQTPGPRYNGIWFDEKHSGEGFILELLADNRAVAYWFTYTASGAKRYFVGVGNVVGKRVVFSEMLSTRGGKFGSQFVSSDITREIEARLVLRFDGCDSGYAEYTVDGVRGSQRLVRLARIGGLDCESTNAPSVAAGLSGSWYNPNASGEGWILQMLDSNSAVIEWFSYRADGQQEWFLATGVRSGNTIDFQDLLMPTGGRFGPYFSPAEVTRPVVGNLKMQFTDCNNASLTWSGAIGAGTTNVTRLTNLNIASCESLPIP